MTSSYTGSDLPPPPLPESDAPMMSNPVLSRRARPKGAANMGWYVGVPVAVVAVGAAAFLIASGLHHQSSLMTTTASTTTAQTQAQAAPAPAPTPAPVPVPGPAAPAQVATASPTEVPVAPPRAITPRVAREDRAPARHVVHHAAAANDSGADVSATAPITPPPPAQVATPAPTESSAPPVLTPPPPSQ
jgi:hypothetical protein